MRKNLLLSSAAFANRGAKALAAYKGSPDPQPLADTVERMQKAPRMAEDITGYASDMASMVDYWEQVESIVDGYKAVRDGAEKFLPKFHDETSDEYKARLKLTKFTNIYRDIVESLAAKPFEEEVTLNDKASDELKQFCENVDGQGNNITVFLSQVFFNGINSAIHWIFVDYPTVDTNVIRTRQDEKEAGIRPFWSNVLAKNVRQATVSIINGKHVLTYARIFEPGVSTPNRVRIFERGTNGVFWELWEESEQAAADGKKQYMIIASGKLGISLIPLIPFITGRRDGTNFKVLPHMQDAADLQIQLYQDESALKFAKTLTGYPMLAANGMVPEMEPDGKTPKKLRVGPARVLWGKPDGAGNHGSWAFVEPSAQSLKFLADDIKETKQDLRELGRIPLTAQSGNLTTITAGVAAGKSRSAVSAWALVLKDAAENALMATALWMNIQDEPEVNIYNEFDNFLDGGTDIEALISMRAAGDLSRETLWFEMRRRKVMSPDFDGEKELDRILSEIPGEPDLDNQDDQNNPDMQPGNAA